MFCTNCGAKLDDGAVFCTHCGARIGQEAPAAAVQSAKPANVVEAPVPSRPAVGDGAEAGSAKGNKSALAIGIVLAVAAVLVIALVLVFVFVKPFGSGSSGNGGTVVVGADEQREEVELEITNIDNSRFPEDVTATFTISVGDDFDADELVITETDSDGSVFDIDDFDIEDAKGKDTFKLVYAPGNPDADGERELRIAFSKNSEYEGEDSATYKAEDPLAGTPWTHTEEFTFITENGKEHKETVRVDDNGYVLADSSSRKYTASEIKKLKLTNAEKCIAWNELFARQGYDFKSCMYDWFSSRSWYYCIANYRPSLTGVAASNYSLLRSESNPYCKLKSLY